MGDIARVYGSTPRVDLVFTNGSGVVYHKAYDGTSWGSETILTGAAANAMPQASWYGTVFDVYVKSATGAQVLHVFWDGSWPTETIS